MEMSETTLRQTTCHLNNCQIWWMVLYWCTIRCRRAALCHRKKNPWVLLFSLGKGECWTEGRKTWGWRECMMEVRMMVWWWGCPEGDWCMDACWEVVVLSSRVLLKVSQISWGCCCTWMWGWRQVVWTVPRKAEKKPCQESGAGNVGLSQPGPVASKTDEIVGVWDGDDACCGQAWW